jgi:hypothetical protein
MSKLRILGVNTLDLTGKKPGTLILMLCCDTIRP